jgi:hypothetical protein
MELRSSLHPMKVSFGELQNVMLEKNIEDKMVRESN